MDLGKKWMADDPPTPPPKKKQHIPGGDSSSTYHRMSSDQNPDYLLYIEDEQLPSYIYIYRDYFISHETRVQKPTSTMECHQVFDVPKEFLTNDYTCIFRETCKPPLNLPTVDV